MRRKKLEKLTNIIEAILFASGNAVPMDLLRDKLSLTESGKDTAVRHLEKKYTGDCGIRLLTFNHKLQFATNPDYKDPVASVLNPIREKEFTVRSSNAPQIIAYKQPITRAELEAVRGINSDYAITTLQSLDMITPCGRKDVPGKPILYATTDNFLKRFKLKSLSDLPDYDELMEKIAEINAANEASSYLYEKEVYDPEKEAAEDEAEEKREKANSSEGGFELPDFLKDIEDGIIKIQ